MRIFLRAAWLALGMALTVGVTAGSALADCHTTRYASGSGTMNKGPAGGYGAASWNVSTRSIRTTADGRSLASGYCVTAAFDWATVSGHFDARMARDCDPGSGSMLDTQVDSNTGGRTLRGMQKWGVCYGPNNTGTGCTTSSMSVSGCTISTMNFVFGTGNNTTRQWRRNSNGTYFYDDGGNPASASD